jgi:hypothetical protein
VKCKARRREKGQTACKPGSVPPAEAGATIIPLDRPLLDGSRDLPGRLGPGTALPDAHARKHEGPGAPSLFGLAPGGACHAVPVAGSAVRSYRTLSPLPREDRNLDAAVYSLWRYPWGRPRRVLPATLSPWSPDFPRPHRKAGARPPGRLTR